MSLNNLINFSKKIEHQKIINSDNKLKIHQDILNEKTNMDRINNLESYIEASKSALDMLKDILESMIDITKEASIVSENKQIMTKYNRHLLNLRNEFFNVVETWKYKNRNIFAIVNSDTDFCDKCSLGNNLVWSLPVILNKNSSNTIKYPKLSLGGLELDNEIVKTYSLKLETIDQNDYISNLDILKKNYNSIEKLCQTAEQLIVRLNIRKSTISLKISGLENQMLV